MYGRWDGVKSFYKEQTTLLNIFSIFSVICVRLFKQSINSTVAKSGCLCYPKCHWTKLCKRANVWLQAAECSQLRRLVLRWSQPPAKCCDVDHRHDVRRPVSQAKRYADELMYSRRSRSLRWISVGDDLRCCQTLHGYLRSFSLTGTIF